MSKNQRRIFIVTVIIEDECWHYKGGEIIKSAVISNNPNNAVRTFEDRHCGSEYPFYRITEIYDTYNSDCFKPNINSKNLM